MSDRERRAAVRWGMTGMVASYALAGLARFVEPGRWWTLVPALALVAVMAVCVARLAVLTRSLFGDPGPPK